MCGIFGIYNADPSFDWGKLQAGVDELAHRGPDDTGLFRVGSLGLGHRRLSVVDLTAGGRQPMSLLGGAVAIVFNGEIYNFREVRDRLVSLGAAFSSVSDTEVLLKAYMEWGVDCLRYLDGMFAFCIFDARSQMLFLARDRAGEKPLFFYRGNGTFRFASELKAILSDIDVPRSVSRESLDRFLRDGYVGGDRCILEGFGKVPPAHAMSFRLSDSSIRVWRYWDLPCLSGGNAPAAELYSELEALLDGSVRRQTQADVPVAVMLSGGLDSSLVATFAARHMPRLETFCVVFPGRPSFDESAHARLVASHLGSVHSEVEAGEVSRDLLVRLFRQFDEPVADSSIVPTFLVTEAIRRRCTVALGGDGGDELFGGYKNYSKALRVDAYKRALPESVRHAVSISALAALPVGMRGRTWAQYLGASSASRVFSEVFDSSLRCELLRSLDGSPQALRLDDAGIGMDLRGATSDLLQYLTRGDFVGLLAEDILVKVDRASMLSSLEVRAPFLDRGVVEFAFSRVSSERKASRDDRKIFLKDFARRYLPAGFDFGRKQGFTMPVGEVLCSPTLLGWVREVLFADCSVFDRDAVQGLFRGLRAGLANGERVFALLQFELWRSAYGVSIK